MMAVDMPAPILFGEIEAMPSKAKLNLPWRSFSDKDFKPKKLVQQIFPVIPVEKNGQVEMVLLRPGEFRQDEVVTEVSEPETPESTTSEAVGWIGHEVGNRQSLYSVLATHDFGMREKVSPRGLQNSSNMCFFNAVLQSLIHCEAMYALLRSVQTKAAFKIKSSTPVLDGLVSFVGFYGLQKSSTLSASAFYNTISTHPNFKHLVPGRQEDAQEFLGYLLDTLEENFDAAEPAPGDEELIRQELASRELAKEEEESSDWTQMGKNNKKVESREAGRTDHSNPILVIFGGRLRSVLKKPGESDSVTLESFQQVCVDISSDSVESVQDAIDHMLEKEELQIESRNKTVIATKQLEFDRLPPVLVVTIKRFTFTYNDGSLVFGKTSKSLAITNVTVECGGAKVTYRPVALVYHHGPSATVGHYTADVLVGDTWYNTDDEYVRELSEPTNDSKSVYIIFYERV